jgi:antirestriction protein ArdC
MPDLYQSVTNKIITQLEMNKDELGTWACPWYRPSIGDGLPRSADGRPYRGVNIITLWAAAMDKNYLSPVWATYKQWSRHGCQVRRGEKAELVVFYKKMNHYNIMENKDEERLMIRAFFVFNSQQVDGYQEPPKPEAIGVGDRVTVAEEYFNNVTDAQVRSGGQRAYYSPTHDFIAIPEFSTFKDAYSYYATLGHEHIHWTGHQTRLNRELQTTRFGDSAYAFEELVAELGAAFLCAQLGIDNEPRIDHAQYLNSWLKVLKQDKKAIFTAANRAQKALDYLNAYQPISEISVSEISEMEDAQ